jgi:hypothetical protein
VNKIDTTDKLAGWGEGRMDWRGFGQKGVLSENIDERNPSGIY